MSVGKRDERRRRFLDVSRKQKQFASKRRHNLLGSDAGPELLSGEVFDVLLYSQIRGRVTNKESPTPVA